MDSTGCCCINYDQTRPFLDLQSMVGRLKDNVDDHRQYDEALDSAARWLADVGERVAACSDTAGDWHLIQDRIEEIKVRRLAHLSHLTPRACMRACMCLTQIQIQRLYCP